VSELFEAVMHTQLEPIVIDGSHGEGGGQILRTALALSLATGRPFAIDRIRAKRTRPGLLRQHLTAVAAAAEVGRAVVEGAAPGSTRLVFRPTAIVPGRYTFAVGTAGSATLVLQTVLPALLNADGPSDLVLEGGTHNPWAPPFDFLARVFLPILTRLGASVTATIERHGFYPAGGGRFHVAIRPTGRLQRLTLTDRGVTIDRRVIALVSNLDRRIGEREVGVVQDKLGWPAETGSVEAPAAAGPGNVVMIEIASEQATEIFTGFGEMGVRAEAVAGRAVDEARKYLAADAPVGPYLADQLLAVLVAGSGGVFRTSALSRHTTTNIDVIRAMSGARIDVRPMSQTADAGRAGRDGSQMVQVDPC
jgi:RNA 3'-terminal phosphate cyclase (ATP)